MPPRAKGDLDATERRPAPNLKADHAAPGLDPRPGADPLALDEDLRIARPAQDSAAIEAALPGSDVGPADLPAAPQSAWLAAHPTSVVATTAGAWFAAAPGHQDEGSGATRARRLADAGLGPAASASATSTAPTAPAAGAADPTATLLATAAPGGRLAQAESGLAAPLSAAPARGNVGPTGRVPNATSELSTDLAPEPTPALAPKHPPGRASDRGTDRMGISASKRAPGRLNGVESALTPDQPVTGPAAPSSPSAAALPLATTDPAALDAPGRAVSQRLAAQDDPLTAADAMPRAADARRGAIEIQGFDPASAAAHKPAPRTGSTASPGVATAATGNEAVADLPRGDPPALTGPTLAALADAAPTPVPQLSSSPPAAGAPVDRGVSLGSSDGAGRSSAAAEAQINAPLHSAAFGPALGLQISALARDGTQEARLHLNPAELGPIMVRIALDGAGARVDFQADLATTRQAIEASLPALAGALRESGLTLTGGGVSQQPSGHPSGAELGNGSGRGNPADGRPGNPSGNLNGHGAAGDELLRPLRATPLRRGLVDLVA